MTVLAPADGYETQLEDLGCRFIDLAMDAGGLNPRAISRCCGGCTRSSAASAPTSCSATRSRTTSTARSRPSGSAFRSFPMSLGSGQRFFRNGALQRIAEQLYRAAFRSLPVVFFQNEDDAALFRERRLVREDQVRVLPGSGVDLEYFAPAEFPPESAPPTFLMIARLLRDKGVVEFVEAAKIVRERYPAARFQLIGAADAENRTAISLAEMRQWERSHGVEYLGPVDDVRPHIAAAHCVVLPSYREGAPRTLIEAAAMARPVITTDVPGCRGVVDVGRTGFLCAPRDATELSAACLNFLSLARQARIEMGTSGRQKMEREYNHDLITAAYRETLRAFVLDEPDTRRRPPLAAPFRRQRV